MIGMVTGAVLRGEIPNARIVPVTLNYEKVLEIDAIVTEQMGQPKKMESFSGAVTGGIRTLKQNFGSVKVCFGEEISIQRFRKNLVRCVGVARSIFVGYLWACCRHVNPLLKLAARVPGG